MTDLPIPSAPPVPAASARPAANSSPRSDGTRDAAAQGETDPFQAVLAQEIESAVGTAILPAKGPALAPVEGDTQTTSDVPVQAVVTGDAPLTPFLFGMMPSMPATASPSTAGVDQDLSARSARVLDAIQGRLGNGSNAAATTATASTDPRLPAATGAAERGPADLAAPGKLQPTAGAAMPREFKLDPALPDPPKAIPAAMTAVHVHDAAPAAQATAAIVQARVGQHGWDQALGDKLVWMAGQSHQVAQLHLNPPELGPLDIMLTLNNDQASAQFVSAHAAVREAIETAMPRLREMLAESGITLGDASVGADAFRDQAASQRQHDPRTFTPHPALAESDAGPVVRGSQSLRLSQGLVDTFA